MYSRARAWSSTLYTIIIIEYDGALLFFTATYPMLKQFWCWNAHIKSGPGIFYPTVSDYFVFQPSHPIFSNARRFSFCPLHTVQAPCSCSQVPAAQRRPGVWRTPGRELNSRTSTPGCKHELDRFRKTENSVAAFQLQKLTSMNCPAS
jgi:hypothetical protein